MMIGRVALFALGFVALTTNLWRTPSTAYACSCATPITQEEYFERATTIFSGRVLDLGIETSEASTAYRWKAVLFEVLSTWKGTTQSQIIVYTAVDGAMCGIDFGIGETWLVFADDWSGVLGTGICDRTSRLNSDDAHKDLQVLGSGQPPVEQVNLTTLVPTVKSLPNDWWKTDEDNVSTYTALMSPYMQLVGAGVLLAILIALLIGMSRRSNSA